MKKTIAIICCFSIIASAYAGDGKKEKSADQIKVTIDVHTDKKGNVTVDLEGAKDIEDLLNKCLNAVTIEMSEGEGHKSKKYEVSLNIKEKK